MKSKRLKNLRKLFLFGMTFFISNHFLFSAYRFKLSAKVISNRGSLSEGKKSSRDFKRSNTSHKEYCVQQISKLYPQSKKKSILNVCKNTKVFPGCYSQKKKPLFHYEKASKRNIKNLNQKRLPMQGKRILTISLIHGDEENSVRLAYSWLHRLNLIQPRNTWRVLPIVNPDGWALNTRTNFNGVDLNRNFPTAQWKKYALQRWIKKKKSDPRRYPGPYPASEPETQCIINHLKDFKPDFIISIHTPYGVLDFDGPKKIKFPVFRPLPWISLGHFPGSLGRYMWKDQNIPVLTIELKEKEGFKKLEAFDRLQDISGTVAIQAIQIIKKTTK